MFDNDPRKRIEPYDVGRQLLAITAVFVFAALLVAGALVWLAVALS